MEIRKVEIQNFQSYAHKQTLPFYKYGPGLYFIEGRNRAGKSSILEAICWCFYGKTSRNLRGDSVVCWFGKGNTEVSVELKARDGEIHTITRGRPKSLAVDGVACEQGKVDDIIGFSFDMFLYTVLQSQFGAKFMLLRPTEKEALFSSVLHLGLWDRCSKIAKKNGEELEGDLSDFHSKTEYINGKLEQLEEAQRLVEGDLEAWNRQREDTLEELDEKVGILELSVPGIEEEISELEKHRNLLIAKRTAQVERKTECRKRQDIIRRKIETMIAEMARLDKEREILEKQRLMFLQENQCYVCLQQINPQHKRQHISRLKKNIRNVNKEEDRMKSDRSLEEKELADETLKFDLSANEIEKLSREIENLRRDIEEKGNHKEDLEEQIEDYLKEIDFLRTGTNPYQKRANKISDDITESMAQLDAIDTEMTKIQSDMGIFTYWEKNFRIIKGNLIRTALDQLEIEVNTALASLGLDEGWNIEFEIEEQTEDSPTKKFLTYIKSPSSPEGARIPFESWCGGETQRLKIAGSIGFGNLIESVVGLVPNLEFWDEPSSWLESDGINDLLDMLRDRAHRLGRQVWVIDHRNLEYTGIDNKIVVKRMHNEMGSTVNFV